MDPPGWGGSGRIRRDIWVETEEELLGQKEEPCGDALLAVGRRGLEGFRS